MKFREIIIKSIDVPNGTYTNIANEVKNITPLDIYLVPKENGQHERFVADDNGLVSKQAAGSDRAFVPMDGLNMSTGEKITGKLILSNYDYPNQPAEENTYLSILDEEGASFTHGKYNNASEYFDLKLNKDAGLRFTQNTDNFGVRANPSFYVNRDGINLGYVQLSDGTYQRAGTFSINNSGIISFATSRSNVINNQTDYANLIVNPDSKRIQFYFYRGSTGTQKNTFFSIDGIQTDALPNAMGDPTFTRMLVQKEDGTFGYTPKTEPGILRIAVGNYSAVTSFWRIENPSYYAPVMGRYAVEIVPPDPYNSPGNNSYGATGELSLALGFAAKAYGKRSVALGSGSNAPKDGGVAIGWATAGISGVAINAVGSVDNGGNNCMISTSETTIGNQSNACVIIGGRKHKITDQYVQNAFIYGGESHEVRGAIFGSIIGGYGNVTTSAYETILGVSATIGVGQFPNGWTGTDRLLVVGNGAEGSGVRSDAFMILKNGTVTMPSFTLSLLKTANGKAAVTKESVELANTTTKYPNSAALNTAFPNALRGFEVYEDGAETMYKKLTETKWGIIPVTPI
ncbi:hypothetical protein J2810_004638 [Chryseobacterium rhizosphaerae]|uniref:hypothetical protein n=1 Tax=Chryseobacterium rhizosphaerae TaxID=395937 RepID=UPI00285E6437|nr:hypothetical protein [Chryseobacterium rhizosphaerae]MDR6548548.1 hypothetical protein [Chryseobacterium rhizosphaerae]